MTTITAWPALLNGAWQEQNFVPFREGIDICTLHAAKESDSSSKGDGEDQTVLALLRYQAGASVPRHRHPGVETILVLEGSQSDESGCYPAGSLIINPIGSEHSVWSEHGCVVLIQWNRPVQFV